MFRGKHSLEDKRKQQNKNIASDEVASSQSHQAMQSAQRVADATSIPHVNEIIGLQQTIGNRAVQRKLSNSKSPRIPLQPSVTGAPAAVIQRALIDDLPEAKSYEAMRELIHIAPMGERRDVLAQRDKLITVQEGLTPEQKTALVSALLEGSQDWENPKSPGKIYQGPFADFLAGKDDLMSAGGKMNCWESVLYAAYLSGILDRKRILEWLNTQQGLDWRKINQSGVAPNLWKSLGLLEAVPYKAEDEKPPEPGTLVFYSKGENSWTAEHVVLSLGDGYAMSLAGEGTSVTRIKINAYNPELKIKVGKKITEIVH